MPLNHLRTKNVHVIIHSSYAINLTRALLLFLQRRKKKSTLFSFPHHLYVSSCYVSLICLSSRYNNLHPIFFGERESSTFSHWSAALIPLLERAESIIGGINVFSCTLKLLCCQADLWLWFLSEMEGGRQLLSDLRTICLVLAQHSVLLRISTYKYIHFSHLAFQRSLATGWAMLAGRWEARTDWSWVWLWKQRQRWHHWWEADGKKGCSAGCLIRVFLN